MKHKIFAMDQTGHSERASFAAGDSAAIENGAAVFAELKARGFTAFELPRENVEGGRRVDNFEEDTSVVMIPRMIGG